jgi:transposase-like protein
MAKVFLQEVVHHHGEPATIISDRGPQFASTIWGEMCSRPEIDWQMSTAFRAQIDG